MSAGKQTSNHGFTRIHTNLKGHGFSRAAPHPNTPCHPEATLVAEGSAFLKRDCRVEYAFQAYRISSAPISTASAAEVNPANFTSAAKAPLPDQPRSCTPEGVLHPSAFSGGAA